MLGAIAGDIIGSIYEGNPIKTKQFQLFHPLCHFTDDTVMTVAVARAILEDRDYLKAVRELGRKYPHAGYGATFFEWLFSDDPKPYNSWGNGAAMRVSPVGFAFEDLEEVLREASRTAAISHNHPEGIKGAQATALSIYLARKTGDKQVIREELSERFGYDLKHSLDEIRPHYRFDISCQGTVPAAIIAFLDSRSYEDAVRNAISLGGDSDTLACIAGGIAEAYYGPLPRRILDEVRCRLTLELWSIVERFYSCFGMELWSRIPEISSRTS